MNKSVIVQLRLNEFSPINAQYKIRSSEIMRYETQGQISEIGQRDPIGLKSSFSSKVGPHHPNEVNSLLLMTN